MEAGTGASEPGQDLRTLREEYRGWYRRAEAEAGPCRDPRLLGAAARYLRAQPEPGAAFSLLPFPGAVSDNRQALEADCRRHLAGFVRATELLETLSTNLLLRGWRAEVRTIKTYTGAFVYGLLPVLSWSNLQSILSSIGYLVHLDGPHREFRLREDADVDRAMLVGFELLLARLECQNLLDLQQKDQLGPQELLDVLDRRFQPTKFLESLETKAAMEQKEEEGEEKKKKEEFAAREAPPYSPRPKPRRTRLLNADQSLMEMQKTYPDLTFRGRKLLPEISHKAHGSTRSRRSAGNSNMDAPAAGGGGGGLEAGGRGGGGLEAGRGGGGGGGLEAGGEEARGETEELSGPQPISLHITLRAGLTAEQSVTPGDLQPTAEPAEQQKKIPSLNSVDEEQELRGLAERMGQLSVSRGAEEEQDEQRSVLL